MEAGNPFVIITGLSGSGKDTVLKAFEDMGYFCVDNLPLELIPKFAELCNRARAQIKRAAIVIDVREGAELARFPKLFETLKQTSLAITLVYLEATPGSLIRRYSETRRPHPLKGDEPIAAALAEERRRLAPLRKLADQVIDTSPFNVHELRRFIVDKFQKRDTTALLVSLVSFGFKHGLPAEADLVFDVRFLPNPNFVPQLKHKNGNDPDVASYVQSFDQTRQFLRRLEDLFLFLIPNYAIEGKSYLTIAFGCTGGRHRSVAIANQIGGLLNLKGYTAKVLHRDLALS